MVEGIHLTSFYTTFSIAPLIAMMFPRMMRAHHEGCGRNAQLSPLNTPWLLFKASLANIHKVNMNQALSGSL